MKYTVVIERTPNNYAAYVPDLPGCVATANTRRSTPWTRRFAPGPRVPYRRNEGRWRARDRRTQSDMHPHPALRAG